VSPRQMSSRSSLSADLKLWEVDFNSLELVKQIGEGSFGRVRQFCWSWSSRLGKGCAGRVRRWNAFLESSPKWPRLVRWSAPEADAVLEFDVIHPAGLASARICVRRARLRRARHIRVMDIRECIHAAGVVRALS